MKKIAPIALALPLALMLTACGDDNGDTNTEQATQQEQTTTQAPDEGASDENPAATELGQTVNLSQLPGNETNFTLTDMSVGEECRYGTNDYGGEEDPEFGKVPEGKQLLQLWADVDVVHVETSVGNDWIMVEDPIVQDADGYTQTPDMDVDCRPADDGHELWSSTIDSGQKMRIYGSFIIPEGATKIGINGFVYDL